MSVMPPPIVVRQPRADHRDDLKAADRFYEEMGFEYHYRLIARWRRLVHLLRRAAGLRSDGPRLTKRPARSSC